MGYARFLGKFTVLALALPGLMALSCGDDKEGGEEDNGSNLQPVNVCGAGGVLAGQCGDSCSETEDCPSGQFCDDGSCKAECTDSSGCLGPCSDDGHCNGDPEMVVVTPMPNGTDNFIEEPGGPPSGGGDFEACATDQTSGELTPVTMYVMFDRSSSMNQNQKWDRATAALQSFFRDPNSADLGIAYGVFPTETGGCDMNVCDVGVCQAPLVNLGVLAAADGDAHEEALVSAVDQDNPSGGGLGTPIGAALQGALNWATDYQASHSNESAVVVLVTDGEPQGCGDINEISDIAEAGRNAGVRTYAIGLEGSREQDMDRIAQAGGTGDGIFIGNGDANADLLEALNTIRGEAASCDIQLPDGDNIDTNKVNVELSLSGEPVALGQVMDATACPDDGAAWHYDDPSSPSRILLCESTCDAVQNDPMAQIDIVLGCETSGVIPPITR